MGESDPSHDSKFQLQLQFQQFFKQQSIESQLRRSQRFGAPAREALI
jgi:hypothetical protein